MSRLVSAAARALHTSDRLLSALLMAAAVTLLAVGLLWYGSPGATGADAANLAASGATAAPVGDPGNFPTPTSDVAAASVPPLGSILPGASPSASATQSPVNASPSASPDLGDSSVATRVVVPSLEIDLPIISPDVVVPNQGPGPYPPCDVAIYHLAFGQPGEAGTTYLYGHARTGMFLPLLTGAEHQNGAGLIGSLVEVYTDDDLRYVYAITVVKRHALDFSIAEDVPTGVSQLVLQTSEGPRGTVPKLQVLAVLQDVLPADHTAAHPRAKPRACYDTP
jgi:hypothetical protein